jgi:hypothetical protein
MGRGRPKGSRNKITSALVQLLDQSGPAVVAKCIHQAIQGDHGSQRLVIELILRLLPYRSPAARLGVIQGFEDLQNAAVKKLRQMFRGDITPTDAQAIMSALGQVGRLFEQRAEEKQSQQPPKQILPDFMIEALEAVRRTALDRDSEKYDIPNSGESVQ